MSFAEVKIISTIYLLNCLKHVGIMAKCIAYWPWYANVERLNAHVTFFLLKLRTQIIKKIFMMDPQKVLEFKHIFVRFSENIRVMPCQTTQIKNGEARKRKLLRSPLNNTRKDIFTFIPVPGQEK